MGSLGPFNFTISSQRFKRETILDGELCRFVEVSFIYTMIHKGRYVFTRFRFIQVILYTNIIREEKWCRISWILYYRCVELCRFHYINIFEIWILNNWWNTHYSYNWELKISFRSALNCRISKVDACPRSVFRRFTINYEHRKKIDGAGLLRIRRITCIQKLIWVVFWHDEFTQNTLKLLLIYRKIRIFTIKLN